MTTIFGCGFANDSLKVDGDPGLFGALNGRDMISGADNNAEGTPLLVFEVDAAAAATTNITVTNGVRVIDVLAHKNGAGDGGGGVVETLQVLNVGNAITGTMNTDLVANGFFRPASDVAADTIDDAAARHEIAADGTLRVTTAGAGTSAADVFLLAIRT